MEGIIENLLDTEMELCYNERLDKRLIPCLLFGKPGDLGRLVVPLIYATFKINSKNRGVRGVD